jgi:hypothetical protein
VVPPQDLTHNYEENIQYPSYGLTNPGPPRPPTAPCLHSQPHCSHPTLAVNQIHNNLPYSYISTSNHQYLCGNSPIAPNTYMTADGFTVPTQFDSLFIGTTSAVGTEESKISREKKFKCTICSKLFTHRSRAEACAAKDKGERPFACDGKCGIPDW